MPHQENKARGEERRSESVKMKERVFNSLDSQWTENDRQEIRHLQQEQVIYGIYTLIPGTGQTYEGAIQSLVADDLRQQYEMRRRRKMRVGSDIKSV
jgi:hypothetical protein